MQFVKSQKRRNKIKLEASEAFALYDNVLQFYKNPPKETISLQEFEEFAVERLKVLKAVENAGIRFVRGSAEYDRHLEKEIRNTAFKQIIKGTDDDELTAKDIESRKIDHISHFILRLAYCRSEELRRWFLQQEMDLFRFRFQLLKNSKSVIEKFMKQNDLDYQPISNKEKDHMSTELAQSGNMVGGLIDTIEYFKVPFTEALDLVKNRKVFLQRGFAYVPRDDLVSILLTFYRTHLSLSLAVTSRALPHLEEDDRLLPMLCGLSKRYLGQDYSNRKPTAGQITADMIDMLSKKSFPLCMQHVHQSMRQNHHIKHGSRMQYGLFLKGIGMSLDEAMKLMRGEFTKLIDVDKFDKQYSYNIRHLYGKEGKRTDYTPYSCLKIIMSNPPGPGDSHGCPFRHMDADLLQQRFRSMSISKEPVEKIMDYIKGGHYQMACTAYYNALHNVDDSGFTLQHPNQYFEESQKEVKGLKKEGNASTPRTPRTVRIVGSQNTPRQSQPSQNVSMSQMSGVDEMDDDFTLSEQDFESAMQESQ